MLDYDVCGAGFLHYNSQFIYTTCNFVYSEGVQKGRL